jgi:serine/threonine-protein kinase
MDIGTVVGGRYRIVRELGRGGMGVVYEALQEDLRRPVAIKLMRGLQCSGEDYDRFVREARIAASVSSPHLVQVLDFSSAPVPFIVMELLAGETLADRLRAGPLPEAEVVLLARQILSVLSVVHAQGIIHRDLKPANIFFTNAPGVGRVCKVLDFGIAKLAQATRALTQEGSMLGTVPYMAPEQLLDHASVTPSADLYALGVCMFEALTGRRPTTRVDFAGIVTELQTSASPPVRSLRTDVSPALAAIVDRALARQPSQRYADANAMAAALHELTGSAHRAPLGRDHHVPGLDSAGLPGVDPRLHSGTMATPPTVATGDSGEKRGSRRAVVAAVAFAVVATIAIGLGVGLYWGASVGDGPAASDRPTPSGASLRSDAAVVAEQPIVPSSVRSASTGAHAKVTPRADAGAIPSASASTGPSAAADGSLNTPCATSREGETVASKNTVCSSGKWKCRSSLGSVRECGDHCENINDKACTACSTPCASDKICKVRDESHGECVACPAYEALCRLPNGIGACVNLAFDTQNCGRCGNWCTHRCINSVCQ